MKYLFICIIALASTLLAKMPEITYLEDNISITINSVQNYDKEFKRLNSIKKCNKSRWLRFDLKDANSSRKIIFIGCDFDTTSLKSEQRAEKIKLEKGYALVFDYNKSRDNKVFYLKTLPKGERLFINGGSLERFIKSFFPSFKILFLNALLLGVILMSAFYNGIAFAFIKKASFIYYFFMQIFMVLLLAFQLGIPLMFLNIYDYSHIIYNYLGLFIGLFATLFVKSFFDTKKYIPLLDKVLNIYFVLIFLDMIYYKSSLLAEYRLFSIAAILFLVIAFVRLKQGFKPALYFLIGWSFLIASIFIIDFNYFWEVVKYIKIDPMILGSAIEALMLAFALMYNFYLTKKEHQKQKELLVFQNKLASMGELIGNIAHQWRQPLTNLSYIIMNIEAENKNKTIESKIEEANRQIEYMSETIEDFMSFYKPKQEKESFFASKALNNLLKLVDIPYLKVVKINDFKIDGYKSQLEQVLLNLVINSKEALEKNSIKEPKIYVYIDYNTIKVVDNGGGIEGSIKAKIFEPYFTTKAKGLGLGLYMAKVIIEKNFNGTLEFKNIDNGVEFIIRFNQ